MADTIAELLAHIINLSVECGRFPKRLKVPLFKSGIRLDIANYIPAVYIFENLHVARVCTKLSAAYSDNDKF